MIVIDELSSLLNGLSSNSNNKRGLFKLEMERALLDVEHSNELKSIQSDEAKLKHLQQEHQLRLDAFNLHTNQVILLFLVFNRLIFRSNIIFRY